MKLRHVFVVTALVAVLSLGLSAAAGKEQGEGSPEEQMMMQKWQAYMTPGDPHAEFETILGGRYMVQHATSPFMGQTFIGMGLTAYDNIKKKYQAIWVDNMGTGVMYSEGTCKGKICTYLGEGPDVILGKYKKIKSVIRNVSNDEMVLEMWEKDPDGKEWMNFESTYKRQK